jgi:hypothetical protein
MWRDLTPGQRWTAALAVVLALSLALFGLPRRVIVRGLAAPAAEASGARAAGATGPRHAVPPTTLASGPFLIGGTGGAIVVGGGLAGAPNVPSAPALGITSPAPAVPRVVALVRSGDDPLPDRDDRAVALAFLSEAPFRATVLTIGQDPALCAKAVAAGDVVVAGEGLDPALRACLVAAGRTVLSYDERGGTANGLVVSTRRDVIRGLVEAAVLARDAKGVAGKVGVVAASDLQPQVDAAVPLLRAAGFRVDSVAYLSAAQPALLADVATGVRRFATDDVTTVVFAASVDQQNAWIAQEAVLMPGVRYVVADARDSVTNESYGPMFASALAVTSNRVAWFAREHGETTAQRACRDRFTPHEQFAVDLDGTELARVFMWCEHVALLGRALAVSASGVPLGDALRRGAVSPLTSDLGTRAAGDFGPLQDAVLRWQTSCRCWQQARPFEDVG